MHPLSPQTQSARSRITLSATVFVLWLTLVLLAGQMPAWRLWGINHLAFVSPDIFRGFVGGALVALILIILPGTRSPVPVLLSAQFQRLFHGWRGGVLLAVAAGSAGWFLRSRTALLGDGMMRAADAVHIQPPMPSELLASFLAGAMTRGLPSTWGIDGHAALQIISIASGIGLVIGLWWLVPKVDRQGSRRAVFWILLFGSSRLFAGYVESYAPAVAAVLLWTLAAVAYRRGTLTAWPMILFWCLAVLSHAVAIVLAPATIWVLTDGHDGKRRPLELVVFALLAMGLIAWIVTRIQTMQVGGAGVSGGHFVISWFSQPPHQYGLFSAAHLIDFVNQWLLLAPGGIVAFLLRPSRPAAQGNRSTGLARRFRSPRVFWAFAAGLPVVAGLLLDPKLGWARDWDLFTLFCTPALAGIALWLARIEPGPVRRTAMAIAILSSGLWLTFSADADAEQRRFETLLELDHSRSAYGYEILARNERRHGRPLGEIAQYQKALGVSDNLRYRTNIARVYLELNRTDKAIARYRDVLARDSASAVAHYGLAIALGESDRVADALPHARRAAAAAPNDPERSFLLGVLLTRMNDPAEARPCFEASCRQQPDNPQYLSALADCLARLGDHDDARALWERVVRIRPEFTTAYLDWAVMEFGLGNLAESAKLLSRYKRLVPPGHRVPAAASLVDSLVRAGFRL